MGDQKNGHEILCTDMIAAMNEAVNLDSELTSPDIDQIFSN